MIITGSSVIAARAAPHGDGERHGRSLERSGHPSRRSSSDRTSSCPLISAVNARHGIFRSPNLALRWVGPILTIRAAETTPPRARRPLSPHPPNEQRSHNAGGRLGKTGPKTGFLYSGVPCRRKEAPLVTDPAHVHPDRPGSAHSPRPVDPASPAAQQPDGPRPVSWPSATPRTPADPQPVGRDSGGESGSGPGSFLGRRGLSRTAVSYAVSSITRSYVRRARTLRALAP